MHDFKLFISESIAYSTSHFVLKESRLWALALYEQETWVIVDEYRLRFIDKMDKKEREKGG